MTKKFNVTVACYSDEHYMVDISNKLEKIKGYIDDESYFCVNRPRQYGKTTTLTNLKKFLNNYIVIFISFEDFDVDSVHTTKDFIESFLANIDDTKADDKIWSDDSINTFIKFNRHITKKYQNKEIILMIDEVDKIENNEVFLNFLSMLRKKYQQRKDDIGATFKSVILAGVYDIKKLKVEN